MYFLYICTCTYGVQTHSKRSAALNPYCKLYEQWSTIKDVRRTNNRKSNKNIK